ncbi:MAG: autotransporter outer membrane beta-barrel domain-containing protein [Selenomonadaceae bacterium]|nr:autotransporter outer membrane beta-barrel domain-containing protein [Selenomonadaceae bacterium]
MTVEGNKVVVSGSATVDGDVHGAYVDSEFSTVAQNIVVIANGTVKGNVFGGGTWWGDYMAGSPQNVVNNTVVLGAADGEGTATIKGNVYINWHKFKEEMTEDGAVVAVSGGNLNVYNTGNTVDGDVHAPGANINFYVKDGETDTSTPRLEVKAGSKAYFDNANIKVNVKQLGTIAEDTKYNLFGTSTIEGTPSYTITDDFIDSSTSLVTTGADKGKVILNHANDRANENSKSPSETQIVGVALVNGVMDMMANQGINEAAKAVGNNDGGRSMAPFAAVGGSRMRQNSGSYVDMNTWNVGIGFAKEVTNSHGKLMFGPVVEYGKGTYNSYLDNGVHGSGDSSFWGVGAMMKQENKDGLYYEGSFRVGRLKNDYESRLAGGASYENSATFYALHAGVGKVVKLNEDDTMDYYGKLFYTRQGSSSATLNTGHIYDFHAINSFRTRLGLRYTHRMNKNQDVYAGIAWQHEFGSKANATIHSGMYSVSAPSPSVKGETGIFELGMKVRPSNGKFESNFGFLGSIGKQRGVGFNAQFQWNF